MTAGLVKEGVSISALFTACLIISIPLLWVRWLMVTLEPKQPKQVIPTMVIAPGSASGYAAVPAGSVGAFHMPTDAPTATITPTLQPSPTATITSTFEPSPTVEQQQQQGGAVVPVAGSTPWVINTGYGTLPIDTSRYPGGVVYANEAIIDSAETVTAKISYYWPPYGGINCFGDCSSMADGSYWSDFIGRALACPADYAFGTQFYILGHVWICRDRGGEIKKLEDGTIWLDLLSPVMPYGLNFAQELSVKVKRP